MQIAFEYSRLCDDEELANTIFAMLQQENNRSIEAVLRVTNLKQLLANDPATAQRLLSVWAPQDTGHISV